MAEQQPINIFVVGPMKPVEDDDGRLEREARTINLKQVIEDLVILDLTGAHGNVTDELGLVHAMGLPYVLVTGDSRAPFYVTTSPIRNFRPSRGN